MSNAYKDNVYGCGDTVRMVLLSETELSNLIEFIELEFIDSIRKDPELDNIDYVVSMMNALQKMRFAYESLKDVEVKQND